MLDKLKFKVYCSVICAAVAVVMSIIAVCRTFHEILDFNGLALIVGILALLVTVLIGWQLYLIIDLKSYNEKFNALSANLNNEILRVKGFSALVSARINIAWVTPATRENWFLDYMRYSFEAIIYFSKVKEYNTCWTIVDDLITNIKDGDPSFYNCVKTHKDEWLRSVIDVNNPSRINNFNDLVNLISKF